MSNDALRWVRGISVGSQGAKATLRYLADIADGKHECWPSVPTIAAELEASTSAVAGYLVHLEKIGAIRRELRYNGYQARTSDLITLAVGTPIQIAKAPGKPRNNPRKKDAAEPDSGSADVAGKALPARAAHPESGGPAEPESGRPAQPDFGSAEPESGSVLRDEASLKPQLTSSSSKATTDALGAVSDDDGIRGAKDRTLRRLDARLHLDYLETKVVEAGVDLSRIDVVAAASAVLGRRKSKAPPNDVYAFLLTAIEAEPFSWPPLGTEPLRPGIPQPCAPGDHVFQAGYPICVRCADRGVPEDLCATRESVAASAR